MRKGMLVLFMVAACNNDSARIAELEAALQECEFHSFQATVLQSQESQPSATVTPTATVPIDLPVTMTVGGRIYDVLPILRGEEESIQGDVMVARAKEMNAHLGPEDGEYLLAHQDDIPVAFQEKVLFVFTDWRHPDDPGNVFYVYWGGGRWVQRYDWLGLGWGDDDRVLRRK